MFFRKRKNEVILLFYEHFFYIDYLTKLDVLHPEKQYFGKTAEIFDVIMYFTVVMIQK